MKSVLAAFHDLKGIFSAINLVIADKKCEIFSQSSSTAAEEFEEIAVSCEGALFLGSPIGLMSFVTSSCATIAQSKLSLCDQLTKLDDVQSAMLLLRCCYVPNLNHLARTVHPDLLVHASTIHDSGTKETFSHLLSYDMVDDRIWHQASLPIRMGVFGMIPMLSIRQPAFVASRANAFTELPFRFSVIRPIIDSLLSSSTTPISEAIARSVPPGKISPTTCHVLGKFNKSYLLSLLLLMLSIYSRMPALPEMQHAYAQQQVRELGLGLMLSLHRKCSHSILAIFAWRPSFVWVCS